MTKKELRSAYFAAANQLRDIMLDEYNRHGEETQVLEMWKDLHSLWRKMIEICERL